jgi:hypothetical protein
MSQRKHITLPILYEHLKARIAKHVFGIDRFAMIVFDLYQRSAAAAAPYQDVRVQRLVPVDMPAVVASFPDRERVFGERFKIPGLDGWLIFVGPTLIGFIWIATRNFYERDIARMIEIPANHAFSVDFFIAKDKRFGLAGHHAIWQIMDTYTARGIVRCDNLVNVKNRNSLMFHTFLGSYDTLEGVNVLRILGKAAFSWAARRTEPLIKQRNKDRGTSGVVPPIETAPAQV